MASYGARKRLHSIAIMLLVLIFLSACTLGRSTNAPNEEEITSVPSLEVEQTPQETAQLLLTNTPRPFQTVLPATSIFPTASVSFPTQIGSVATAVPPQQVSIFILSPVPGNIVSGSTQIIGSATHSNFLQYQLEYGPDPNPSNLWYSVSGAVQSPVVNGLLGIWNTSVLNDGAYQLRLRVFLRDGTDGGTVTVNNIMVRNQAPTPVPSATPVIERPIAAFTQSATVGTAPLNVQFTNLSTGSITALQWNFGDGSTSTEINPTHRFNNPGAYSVTLTASGPGGTSNVTRQILVQSPNPPVAAFTPDKTEGLAPLTVTFTDISSGGQITERLWNFGNGQTTTRNNADPVTHTFQSVGTYNVILQVSGPGGLSTATRQIRVGNPIEADIRVTPDTSNPLRFVLEAVVSGGSGSYTNYNWNFGNGQSQTGAQTTATYATSGTYTIQLQVRDSQGNEALVNRIVEVRLPTATPTQTQTPVPPSATATHTLTATTEPSVEPSQTEVAVVNSPVPPVDDLLANFTVNQTSSTDLTVGFDGYAEGGTGTYSYAWEFGDGAFGDGQSASHTYPSAGTYTVRLTVNDGQTSQQAENVVVIEDVPLPALVASFTLNQTSSTDLTVGFDGYAEGGTGTYSYAWEFGDGAFGDGQSASHTYPSAGTYTVRLTVNDGQTSQQAENIVVIEDVPLPALVANFTVNQTSSTDLTVGFDGYAEGGTGTYSYAWEFGDGAFGDGQSASHTYPSAGTYTVRLTVNDGQASQQAENIVVIEDVPLPPLGASFTVNQSSSTDLTVGFDGYAEGGTGTYSYAWEFGDGAFGDGQSASHTYPSAGTYTVRLMVNDGQASQQAENIVVIEDVPLPALVASFTVNQTSSTDLTVGFDGYAEGGTGTYSYAWEFGDGAFGDGAFGDGQSASHTYPNAGTYTVRLTVNDGQTSQQAENVVVIEDVPLPALVASFTVNQTSSTDLTVGFDGYAEGGTGTYSYAWEFGDGTFGDGQSASHTYPNAGTYTVRLTVNDGQTSQQAENIVVIEDVPLPALVASFTVNQTSSTDLTVGFDGYAEGGTGTYSYAWEFGDGTFGDGQSASHTYPNAGTYTVRLTVNDGQTSQQAENIVVIEDVPVLPELVITSFNSSANPSDPYHFNFSVSVTGGTETYSYRWEFGDGAVEMSPEPSFGHRYATQGQYMVTVFVNDGNSEQSANTTVSITTQSITPVQPDVNPYIPEITNIYNNATAPEQENPRNPSVIAVIGDQTVNNANFLSPILQQENYQLDDSTQHISGTIDRFASGLSQQDAPTLDSLLAPSTCDPNISQVVCYINQTQTTVIVIGVGLQEANNPNAQEYQNKLTEVVNQAKNANAIPILVTLYPTNDPAIQDGINIINEAIIQVATNTSVPVINVWRGLNDLPEQGLSGNTPSIDPMSGASYLSANSTGGANMMNYYTLETLTQILNAISP